MRDWKKTFDTYVTNVKFLKIRLNVIKNIKKEKGIILSGINDKIHFLPLEGKIYTKKKIVYLLCVIMITFLYIFVQTKIIMDKIVFSIEVNFTISIIKY